MGLWGGGGGGDLTDQESGGGLTDHEVRGWGEGGLTDHEVRGWGGSNRPRGGGAWGGLTNHEVRGLGDVGGSNRQRVLGVYSWLDEGQYYVLYVKLNRILRETPVRAKAHTTRCIDAMHHYTHMKR